MIGVAVKYIKPYRKGTSLQHIVEAGFYRDFCIMQTWNETLNMGYDCSLEYINECWEKEAEIFELWCKGDTVSKIRAEALRLDW